MTQEKEKKIALVTHTPPANKYLQIPIMALLKALTPSLTSLAWITIAYCVFTSFDALENDKDGGNRGVCELGFVVFHPIQVFFYF